ncbi:branched-chain amino acid aminotransferase [Algoriphagus sp. AGSA1]|uniref:branched-chain amino acid aminotransferase n=1 Tax=Algoriphagus sp. AGSA1 TaxID=2907213 RepID=UPI001F269831|nr:branched-chain amino acid aminotransferase [Algoriphagus sp. AGSA1]MCE7055231.1 branched-chain amino acid aminotransferase [Algoriphagus sp. AGSA1]
MIDFTSLPVTENPNSGLGAVDFDHIVFGQNPTDHMLQAIYGNSEWIHAEIVPFSMISLSPLALCLHYGQTVFEGFKAYRQPSGDISIFRMDKHYQRINRSLSRMGMPELPESLFMQGIRQLVDLERDWIPSAKDSSLYIRPFVFASEPRLGVKAAREYRFMVVCMPMGKYYEGNVSVKVETEFVRAVEGGTGDAKCGGNYAAAILPTQLAIQQGYDQLIWTDGIHHEYMEESGTMNLMFVIDRTLVTPPLTGSILEGITRDSILTIALDLGIPIEERKISYRELVAAFEEGKKIEAFGVGTAAVISPIERIGINGHDYFPSVQDSSLFITLKEQLQDIRAGLAPDRHGWNEII